jgi:hypothetical protein
MASASLPSAPIDCASALALVQQRRRVGHPAAVRVRERQPRRAERSDVRDVPGPRQLGRPLERRGFASAGGRDPPSVPAGDGSAGATVAAFSVIEAWPDATPPG